MKRILLVICMLAVVSMACSIGSSSSTNNPAENNNPGNLNTPDPNNPSQGINTAAPPTDFAPAQGTPVGDSPGAGTPTAPTINEQQTPPLFTPTQPPTPGATSAP